MSFWVSAIRLRPLQPFNPSTLHRVFIRGLTSLFFVAFVRFVVKPRWAYHCSLSRLVLRIDRPTSDGAPPIDLAFAGLSDIRCPVHWVFGRFEMRHDETSGETVFAVPSADVRISASSLVIVVQDEYPDKIWELESARIDGSRA